MGARRRAGPSYAPLRPDPSYNFTVDVVNGNIGHTRFQSGHTAQYFDFCVAQNGTPGSAGPNYAWIRATVATYWPPALAKIPVTQSTKTRSFALRCRFGG
jgi:hypothetical protein